MNYPKVRPSHCSKPKGSNDSEPESHRTLANGEDGEIQATEGNSLGELIAMCFKCNVQSPMKYPKVATITDLNQEKLRVRFMRHHPLFL